MIFVKIFQPAKALEIFLLSADYAIIIRGKYFPEPLSVHPIQTYPTDYFYFITQIKVIQQQAQRYAVPVAVFSK